MVKSLTDIWYNQIYPEMIYYLTDLNWTFIISLIIVLYGVEHTKYYEGFKYYLDKIEVIKKFRPWFIGLIMGLIFFTFRGLGVETINSEYVAQYLRSLILVITFSELVINGPINLIKGKKFLGSEEPKS